MADPQEKRKVKLIWDFRGPNGERTAEHHALHLKEYIKANDIQPNITGFESISNNHSLAYMVIYEDDLQVARQTLKPHRGQVYEEKK